MTDRLPPTLFRETRNHPSVQAILIVFVALFILFLWLNFISAEEIESLGRDIQEKTVELDALRRQQDALLRDISVAGSQQRMADQARALGYQPQTPIYLSVAQPIVLATDEATRSLRPWSAPENSEGVDVESSYLLWDLLAPQSETLELERAP